MSDFWTGFCAGVGAIILAIITTALIVSRQDGLDLSDFWIGFIAGVTACSFVAFLVASVFADVSEIGQHNKD